MIALIGGTAEIDCVAARQNSRRSTRLTDGRPSVFDEVDRTGAVRTPRFLLTICRCR